MLIRAIPTAMAVATGAGVGWHLNWASRMVNFIGNSVSRDVRLGAVVIAVLLSAAAAWELRRPPPDSLAAEPTVSLSTRPGC
jgi:hypothetical protein